MRQMGNASDTSTRKLTAAIAKNEKDLTKKEEQLKQMQAELDGSVENTHVVNLNYIVSGPAGGSISLLADRVLRSKGH